MMWLTNALTPNSLQQLTMHTLQQHIAHAVVCRCVQVTQQHTAYINVTTGRKLASAYSKVHFKKWGYILGVPYLEYFGSLLEHASA